MAKRKTKFDSKWQAKFGVSSTGGNSHNVRCTVSVDDEGGVNLDEVLSTCRASVLQCRVISKPIQENLPGIDGDNVDYEFQATCKIVNVGGKTAVFTLHTDGDLAQYAALVPADKKEGTLMLSRLGAIDADDESEGDEAEQAERVA